MLQPWEWPCYISGGALWDCDSYLYLRQTSWHCDLIYWIIVEILCSRKEQQLLKHVKFTHSLYFSLLFKKKASASLILSWGRKFKRQSITIYFSMFFKRPHCSLLWKKLQITKSHVKCHLSCDLTRFQTFTTDITSVVVKAGTSWIAQGHG